MLECRTKTTNVIKEYIESEGYLLSDASRFSHSLDAFHYNYQNAGGNRDMIKIEINYSLRAHIFEPVYKRFRTAEPGSTLRSLPDLILNENMTTV